MKIGAQDRNRHCGGQRSKHNLFVPQFILGLCAFSQLVPKRISCHPVFVIVTSMFSQCFAPIPIRSMAAWRIAPCLFSVPSTFRG